MQPIVEISHLTHIYSKNTPFERKALDDVSLSLYPGEFVGIIGRTGSGKSTLIQHLNGLLRPTAGKVLLNGEDIWKSKALTRQARFDVGIVFQFPEYQLFEETVFADIAFGPKNMGLSEEEVRRRVEAAMDFVSLPHSLLTQSPFALSGGQKRRVAIAGVIAMEPKVLVLDEPTAGLDPVGVEELSQNIRRYHEETKATIVVISHSMEEVARTAGRLIVFHDGRIPLEGTPAEVFSHSEALLSYGLGIPQMARVFAIAKTLGLSVPGAVFTVPQAREACLSLARRKEGTPHGTA